MDPTEKNARLRLMSERLYGDSRLRENLTDEQAEQLLAWGMRQLEAEVAQAEEGLAEAAASTLETQAEAVRKVLRMVNRIAAQLPEASRSRSREYIGQLVNALCDVDAGTVNINDLLALEAMVDQRAELEQPQIFERLLAVIQAPTDSETAEETGAGQVEAEAKPAAQVPAIAAKAIAADAGEEEQEEEE